MEVPIMLEGEERGSLQIRQEGLYTVFEGQCNIRYELLRLSVYDEEKEGYLGIMQPWSGGMYLRRRLSKKEMSDFPVKPLYAGKAAELRNVNCHTETALEENREEEPTEKMMQLQDACQKDEEDILWFRRGDGSLTGHDGKNMLLALPSRVHKAPNGVVLRKIEGETYMIFRC